MVVDNPFWADWAASELAWLPELPRAVRGRVAGVVVPIWMIFATLALVTGILWWLDRRIPPGHCQKCGYDLTGNVSGRCPECGADVCE